MPRRTPALVLALALGLGTLAGCGSSGGDSASSTTKPKESSTKVTTTPVPKPLRILVGNDDGYSSEGLDTLVTALLTLDDVDVTVVAPLTQQSGQGGKHTDGDLNVTDVKTKGGFPAKAVEGYPADAVRVAIDDLGIEPDLVVTGINEGQNLGPLVDVSGTIGAARAAAKRGVPALATSQGTTKFDYESAVPFILDWIEQNRSKIESGDFPVGVTSMNIPSCDEGEIRGQVSPEVATSVENAIHEQDCTSTTPEADLPTDIEAFNNGFVTLTPVPTEVS